jgi:hypothetical protein
MTFAARLAHRVWTWVILAAVIIAVLGSGASSLAAEKSDKSDKPKAGKTAKAKAAQAEAATTKPAPSDTQPVSITAPQIVPIARDDGSFLRRLSDDQFRAAVDKIDALIAADLSAHGQSPNPPLSDELFVRRAYLEITGTIPTLEQTQAFLADTDKAKRGKLIDELLASPGYVNHFFHLWADQLRASTRIQNTTGQPYIDWIKQALATNMPYDQFVRELLASDGRYFEHPATGYYVRDAGMPLDNAANTVRIFLGTSIGCAQCHDHPFDKWTQIEFYEMAAFTYSVDTRDRTVLRGLIPKARAAGLDAKAQAVLRRLVLSQSFGAKDVKKSLRLPDDYKYEDGKPGQMIAPATMFGESVDVPTGQSSQSLREAYANWLTARDNPRFTTVIANRLWRQVFGRGLIEPVDEITDDTKAVNPALMTHLEQVMKDVNYDMKAYLRVVLNSRSWQRMATAGDLNLEEAYRFPGPLLRRMTAEQVWDSLLTLTLPEPDGRRGSEAYKGQVINQIAMNVKDPEELIALAKNADAQRAKLGREMIKDAINDPSRAKYRGFSQGLVRAAELPSPAPNGHPLRQFGQSDRELIDGANTDPSVTQVLTLLNGPVEKELLGNAKSVLRNHLAQANGPTDKVRTIFQMILTRDPSQTETIAAMREIRDFGDEKGYANIVWALINTREFMFIQ